MQRLAVHMYKAFFSPFRIFLVYFTLLFCFVLFVFVGSMLAKGADRPNSRGTFPVLKKWRYMNHGGGASSQFSARGYFANILILNPGAYTPQLQVLTTIIVICLLWTISESPCWVTNSSSCRSLCLHLS